MDLKTYTKMINDELMKRDYNLIRNTPNYQPDLIGGGRVRDYILSGNAPYDYPATLAVGQFNPTARQRMTLEGAGVKEELINFGKDLAKEFIKKKVGLGRTKKGYKVGGRKNNGFSIPPALRPLTDFSDSIQKTFMPELTQNLGKGRRKKGGKFFEDVKNASIDVGKDIAKELIKKKIRGGAVYPDYQYGGFVNAFNTKAPQVKQKKPFIQNLDEGFDNVFKAVDRIGNIGGKRKSKKGGVIKPIVKKRLGENVRGAIVAEVMKKMGLSLPEASKYVKTHGLY